MPDTSHVANSRVRCLAPVLSRRDGEGAAALAANGARVPTELPEPDEEACPDCGAVVGREDAPTHECEPDDVLDYRLFLERVEPVTLNEELAAYLASPRGQFEAWYAERQRHHKRS